MLKIIFRFIKRLLLLFLVLSVGSVILFRFVPVPFTPLMFSRAMETYSEGPGFGWKKEWVPLSDLPASVSHAMICAEDSRFEEHWGFDFTAIKKAMKQNERGKKVKGASTITQQTAKNLFLWQGRTWLRKGLEAYFTVLLEIFWSKERIMEVYVNIIEMGNGVYGIQAASQTYYKKDASRLRPGEAAMIASILPNPRKWSPLKPSAMIFRKQQRVLKSMQKTRAPEWAQEAPSTK
jgi:monofunctional biosynthetic peptidoglycan transglycosylase